jgi:hypothetical protein
LTCPFDSWFYLLLKPQVKHIVQEYIGKNGAEITALGCPFGGVNKLTRINITRLEKSSDEVEGGLGL